MGSQWKPDDWWLGNGGQDGIDAIDTALKNHKFDLNRIFTSRDPEMDQVRHELSVQAPAGWQSWMLPAYLQSKVTFMFLQVAQPGAVLPAHAHDVAQFRLVLSGGLLYNGIELRGGDWIYTPAGATYSLSVATNPAVPAVITYCY